MHIKNILLLLPIFVCLFCHNMKLDRNSNKVEVQDWSTNDSIPSLHNAVLMGKIENVKYLLDNRVDVMSLNDNGETALMYACKAKNINYKIISLLIEYGSDIMYEREKDFNSAFLICIKNSRDSLMEFLIDRLSLEQKEYLNTNSYYLTFSIGFYRPRIVEKLIPFQIDLNGYDFMERSFLQHAIHQAVLLDSNKSDRDWKGKERIDFNDALEVINILLLNGADVNEESRFSANVNNAIDSPDVLSLLINKGLDLNKPVEKYVGTNKLRRFKLLDLIVDKISLGNILNLQGQEVDINKVSKYNSYFDVLDLLIDKESKGSQATVSPYRQLAINAVERNNLKLMRGLLNRGKVDINFTDTEGETLMMKAKMMKSHNMISLLLKNGANP